MKNYLTGRNQIRNPFDVFDGIFDDFFSPSLVFNRSSEMRTDIKEKENSYELSVDLPGFEKQDIDLQLKNGYLIVTAKKEEKTEDEENYIRRERRSSCSRSFYVGENIEESDVLAKYQSGILRIEVPKNKQKEITKKSINID